MVLDDKNPWDGILASTMFALRATVHTTTQYTPAQLIFGRDSIMNRSHDVDWKTIRKRKQDLINKDNDQKLTPYKKFGVVHHRAVRHTQL